MSDEAAVQTFIFQQFMLLQLLIPVTGAMAFAGYSLIGEKQGRTLEPLLATPITTAELLIAKGLGALLPSLGIMIVALAVYLAGMLAFAAPHVFSAVVSARTALLVMGFGPVAALVALQIAVLVSSRVNDPRTAQQFGALLILPITAVFVMQFNGVIRLTVPVITMALVGPVCSLGAAGGAGRRAVRARSDPDAVEVDPPDSIVQPSRFDRPRVYGCGRRCRSHERVCPARPW